jgi:hypothetical protein
MRGPLEGSSNLFTSFTFAIVKLFDWRKVGLGGRMVNGRNTGIFCIYLLRKLCRMNGEELLRVNIAVKNGITVAKILMMVADTCTRWSCCWSALTGNPKQAFVRESHSVLKLIELQYSQRQTVHFH